MARRPLRVGSTFSGVGGADLGLERAGFQLAWTCEWDEWKRSVLAAHWPNVPHYHNVRDLADPDPVDVLVGGFPCQDLSVAGKRKGFTGERSVLAFDFLRIAESLRPRWLLMENVPGLLSSNGGRDLARLLDEVGTIGYGWAYRILDARYFGVPQRRRRIFICARRADAEFDSGAAAELALRALWEGSSGDSTPRWPPRTLTPTSTRSSTPSGGSVGTHGPADKHPTGTLTRMYAEQSGQDFGGGQESSRVVCEPDPAGALTKRYAKGVNTTMDDGAIIAHTSASDRVNGGGQPKCSAYRKSRRAKSMTDDETWVEADHANTINTFDVGDTRTTHAIVQNKTAAFKAGQGAEAGSIGYEEEMSPTLTAAPSGSNQVPTIHTTNVVAHGVSASDDQVAGTLCTNSQGGQRTTDIAGAYVSQTFPIDDGRPVEKHQNGTGIGDDGAPAYTIDRQQRPAVATIAATLTSGGHPNSNALGRRNEDDVNLVGQQMSVRRLTPVECERLMGWPDDWTAPEGIKAPDSKRYAACGDGIVSHVAYWIGMRIQMIEDES